MLIDGNMKNIGLRNLFSIAPRMTYGAMMCKLRYVESYS